MFWKGIRLNENIIEIEHDRHCLIRAFQITDKGRGECSRMNKRLELFSVGSLTSLFGLFLLFKEGLGLYQIVLFITGIGMLIYGFINRKQMNDFENPELYDERDEIIQNKVSNIVLSILLYGMMFALLINSFIEIPLNYVLVLFILFAVLGKQLIIKVLEKYYDNQ